MKSNFTYVIMFASCILGCIFLVNAGDKYFSTWECKFREYKYVCIAKETTNNFRGRLSLILINQSVDDKDKIVKDYVSTSEFYSTEIGDYKYYYDDYYVVGYMTSKAWRNLIYSGICFVVLIILIAKNEE